MHFQSIVRHGGEACDESGNCQTHFVSAISCTDRISDVVCQRSLNFIATCHSSDSENIRFVIKHAVLCAQSPIGRNYALCYERILSSMSKTNSRMVLNLRTVIGLMRLQCRCLLLIVMLVLNWNRLCWELVFCSLLTVNGVECRLIVCCLLLVHVSIHNRFNFHSFISFTLCTLCTNFILNNTNFDTVSATGQVITAPSCYFCRICYCWTQLQFSSSREDVAALLNDPVYRLSNTVLLHCCRHMVPDLEFVINVFVNLTDLRRRVSGVQRKTWSRANLQIQH